MTKKPSRLRILMMPYQDDEDSDPVGYSGPATVLTGLPRTIRRHELRLIVPLTDSTIYEMEKRGEFPRRFNLTPRCVVWDLEVAVAELELALEVGAPQIVGRRQGTAFRWTAAAGCPIVGHEADYRVGSILARTTRVGAP
jgi:prophage regulatory protein